MAKLPKNVTINRDRKRAPEPKLNHVGTSSNEPWPEPETGSVEEASIAYWRADGWARGDFDYNAPAKEVDVA